MSAAGGESMVMDVATDVGPRARLRLRARLRHVWRVAVWFGWIWPGSLRRETNGVWRTHGARGRRRWRWRAAILLSRFMTFAWPERLSPGRWGHTCRSRPLLIVWWPGLGQGLVDGLRRIWSGLTDGGALGWAASPLRRAMALMSRLWNRPAYRRGAFAGLACLVAAGALAANGVLFNPGQGGSSSEDAGRVNRLGFTPGGAGGAGDAGAGGGAEDPGANGGADGGGGGAGGPGAGSGAGGPGGGVIPISQLGEFSGPSGNSDGGGVGGGAGGGEGTTLPEAGPPEAGGDSGEPQAQTPPGVDASEGGSSFGGGSGGSGGGSGGGGGVGGGGAGGGAGGGTSPGNPQNPLTDPTTTTPPPSGDGGLTFLTPPAGPPVTPPGGEPPPVAPFDIAGPPPPEPTLTGPPRLPDGGGASPGDDTPRGDPGLEPPIFEAPTTAVPEPSSWALMIAGFGMLGSALRASRRRARQPA